MEEYVTERERGLWEFEQEVSDCILSWLHYEDRMPTFDELLDAVNLGYVQPGEYGHERMDVACKVYGNMKRYH